VKTGLAKTTVVFIVIAGLTRNLPLGLYYRLRLGGRNDKLKSIDPAPAINTGFKAAGILAIREAMTLGYSGEKTADCFERMIVGCFKKMTSRAFTLIELLVVVLIIGILAAIVLPQYQKAIEKTRFTKALGTISSLHRSTQVYQLANGIFPQSLDDLDISLNGEAVSTLTSISGITVGGDAIKINDFTYGIFNSADNWGHQPFKGVFGQYKKNNCTLIIKNKNNTSGWDTYCQCPVTPEDELVKKY
jgi:prepilin-type N-terminal cleavage/methylation domain-containing protein